MKKEYNEGDPYEDLFQEEEYDNSIVKLEDKESSPDDEEVYDTNTDEMNDQYLGHKVPLSRNHTIQEGTIIHRLKNFYGTLIRTKNANPILYTSAYEVGFSDGSRYHLAINLIVDNLFDSDSEDGDHHTYVNSVVDIRSTKDAISKDNGYFITPSNNRRKVITTKGWKRA